MDTQSHGHLIQMHVICAYILGTQEFNQIYTWSDWIRVFTDYRGD